MQWHEVLSWHLPALTRKIARNLRMVCVTGDIRTRHLPNVAQLVLRIVYKLYGRCP